MEQEELIRELTLSQADGEIRGALESAGYEILDPVALFDGIEQLYRKPKLIEVVIEELPQIRALDPTFQESHPLVDYISHESLVEMYGTRADLLEQYGSCDDVVRRIEYSLKVWLRHIRFFMQDHPDANELLHAVESYEEIAEGRWRLAEDE